MYKGHVHINTNLLVIAVIVTIGFKGNVHINTNLLVVAVIITIAVLLTE